MYRVNPHTMKEIIVVRSVHTHELYIDDNDNLFGEHLWYNGEQLNTWGHYVWRLNKNGRLDSVIKPTEGFLDNYSFNRDSTGNMYWVQRFTVSRFKMKSVDGTINTIAEGKFKDIRWMYVTKSGIIYFTDLTDLYKLDKKGKFTLLAKNLHERTSVFEYGALKHNILGIWTDKDELDAKYSFRSGGRASYINATSGTVDVSFNEDKGLWELKINGLLKNLIERTIAVYKVKGEISIR